MTTWLYLKSHPGIFTVGFYDPTGDWQPESDHPTDQQAAERVRYLNGGNKTDHDALKVTLRGLYDSSDACFREINSCGFIRKTTAQKYRHYREKAAELLNLRHKPS